jgi:hypothetical protein
VKAVVGGDIAFSLGFLLFFCPVLVGMSIWSHLCKVGYAQQLESLLGHRPKFFCTRLKNHNKFDVMVYGSKFVHLLAKKLKPRTLCSNSGADLKRSEMTSFACHTSDPCRCSWVHLQGWCECNLHRCPSFHFQNVQD